MIIRPVKVRARHFNLSTFVKISSYFREDVQEVSEKRPILHETVLIWTKHRVLSWVLAVADPD